jgi:small subunit ribosomal protein S6
MILHEQPPCPKGDFKFMSTVYETMYILRPDLSDEQVDQAIAKYQTLIQDQGAENIEIQNRGKRRLAYEIKKQRDGIYIQMNYTGPGKIIAPLERAMRLSEEVIRYLTIKQEVSEPAPAEDQVAVTA